MKLLLSIALATISSYVASETALEFEGTAYYIPHVIEFKFEDGVFRYVNYFEAAGRVSPAMYPSTMTGSYEIREREGFTVARVRFPSDTRDLFLFYESQHLIVYDTELRQTYVGQRSPRDGGGLFPMHSIRATSFFTEILRGKEVRYTAENLTDEDISNAWVEGVPGYGKGERLHIGDGGDHVVLLNGFFAPFQPTLYWDNGRLKRVLVRGYDETGATAFEEVYEIPDVPNLFPLQFPMFVDSYVLEILEVYPGRRFEDTAISGLFFDGYRNQMRLRRELNAR